MANFAELDSNNVVKRVVVIHNNESPTEEAGINFLKNLYGADTNWKQTSYNTFGGVHYTDGSYSVPSEDQSKAFRMNYAGVNLLMMKKKMPLLLLKLVIQIPNLTLGLQLTLPITNFHFTQF